MPGRQTMKRWLQEVAARTDVRSPLRRSMAALRRCAQRARLPADRFSVGKSAVRRASHSIRPGRTRTASETLPSWLLSLMTHLLVLVILAALVSPPGGRGVGAPLEIVLSLTDGPGSENASVLVVDEPQSLQVNDARETDPPAVSEGTEPSRPLAATRLSTTEQFPAADAMEAGPTVVDTPEEKTTQADISELLQQRLVVGVEEMERVITRKVSAPTTRSHVLPPEAPQTLDAAHQQLRRVQAWEHDEIVDRFIEYDIGRLRGAAGRQAWRAFERLGPEAIPALVRGLNKSARIRASCPIAVISSKLNRLLSMASDPVDIKYALENLARDVPPTAPHHRALQVLRRRWLSKYGGVARQANVARTDAERQQSWTRFEPEEFEFSPELSEKIRRNNDGDAWIDLRDAVLMPD